MITTFHKLFTSVNTPVTANRYREGEMLVSLTDELETLLQSPERARMSNPKPSVGDPSTRETASDNQWTEDQRSLNGLLLRMHDHLNLDVESLMTFDDVVRCVQVSTIYSCSYVIVIISMHGSYLLSPALELIKSSGQLEKSFALCVLIEDVLASLDTTVEVS